VSCAWPRLLLFGNNLAGSGLDNLQNLVGCWPLEAPEVNDKFQFANNLRRLAATGQAQAGDPTASSKQQNSLCGLALANGRRAAGGAAAGTFVL